VAERHVRGAIINELLAAARYGLEVSNAELRAAGVDPLEYGRLAFIGTLQPVTRTKLAEATGERRTTLRDAIKRLIEAGQVREVPNPRDGRSMLLELTPEGQQIFDTGLPAFQRALRRIDAALGGELDAHEESVWRLRQVLKELAGGDVSD
jgi:DNA-binding MarR family transcriptional regulator